MVKKAIVVPDMLYGAMFARRYDTHNTTALQVSTDSGKKFDCICYQTGFVEYYLFPESASPPKSFIDSVV